MDPLIAAVGTSFDPRMLVLLLLSSIVGACEGGLLVGFVGVSNDSFSFSSTSLLLPIVGAYVGVA